MSTFLTLLFLILQPLISCFYPNSPVFPAACPHPAPFPPLPASRTRDHSLPDEILVVRPVCLAQGAASVLVDSEKLFNADIMQPTGTSHIRTPLALMPGERKMPCSQDGHLRR